MNIKFNFATRLATRRRFGVAMLCLNIAALSACGGGDNEAPTSESNLYRALQLLRVGMTVGDVENIVGRAPDQVSKRWVRWNEGNESIILMDVVQRSSPISFLTWVWGDNKSATYQFKGERGSKPTLLTSS